MPKPKSTRVKPSSVPLQTSNVPSVLATKIDQVQAMVEAMPDNVNKPLEHGFDNGLNPQPGATVKAASRLVTGSTLSEENGSEKTGSTAVEGVNSMIEPLDRVRVDSSGRY